MLERLSSAPTATAPPPRRAAPRERNPERAHAIELERLSSLRAELTEPLDGTAPGQLAALFDGGGSGLRFANALQEYVSTLRRAYLAAMAEGTSACWRTPPTRREVTFPGSPVNYRYAYDRQHAPLALEQRLEEACCVGGRSKGGTLCSSGMAAINVLVHVLAEVLADAPLRIGVFASYFETLTLLGLSRIAGRWTRILGGDELLSAIHDRSYDVLYIEPVQYNWSLEALDHDALLAEMARSPDPPIVVLDTTLSGASEALDDLLRGLLSSGCPLVMRLRSGLKLDQEGFELANLGVLEWWVRPEFKHRFARLERAVQSMRVASGAGVGWHEACALAPRFVLDPDRLRAHSQGIFASARALHQEIALTGDLFSRTAYPAAPWDAPFVLFALRDGGADEYVRLATLLEREAARRGLSWTMSGSFGFRTERFETILPGEQRRADEVPEGILKISCGRYRGERFWRIADLLNELASFDSLSDAERTWSFKAMARGRR